MMNFHMSELRNNVTLETIIMFSQNKRDYPRHSLWSVKWKFELFPLHTDAVYEFKSDNCAASPQYAHFTHMEKLTFSIDTDHDAYQMK